MQGKRSQAEVLYEQSEAIWEKAFDSEQPDAILSLLVRARLLHRQVGTGRENVFKVE